MRLVSRLLLATSLVSVACGESTSSGESGVDRIEVTPPSLSLLVDETKAISARPLGADGTPVERKLFWSSSDVEVATVTQEGIVTAVSAGKADVAVSVGGKSAVVPVTVAGRPATLVRVTPSTSSLRVGQSLSLVAQVLDATGAVVGGRTIEWRSSAPSVATVNENGVVTAVASGTTTITATSGSLSGNALISVQNVPIASIALTPPTAALQVGESLQLNAEARNADDDPLPGRAITWATSAPTVASVSSTGFVIALAPGTATITASGEGKSATSRITVTAVPVASVSVVPASATVSVGQTGQLIARVLDANGAVLNGRAVTWSSNAPNVATVDNDGLVTAVASGSARVTATAEGKSGTATVTVTPIPVDAIAVNPASASLIEGDTQQLTATLTDAQGNTLSGRVVSWVSGSPAIATVDATGLVTAVGPGSVIIIASSEGKSINVPVTVAAASVGSVAVSPSSGTLVQGGALQLTATIRDTRGNVMSGKVPAWSSSNPATATVSSGGLVRAVAPGSVTIRATADGVSGTATLTITLAPVGSVTLSPASATVFTGRTLQLSAALEDAQGNPLSTAGRTVSWQSSAPNVASVSGAGLVTGATPGTATISMTVDGTTGRATITVSDVPVSTVTITPPSASLAVGSSRQLTAVAADAQGNVITGRATTWASSDASVATVSANGLVSALAPGSATIDATIGGVKGSATITVTSVPVASVTVTPSSSSLAVGGTVQLSAAPKDAQGNTLAGRSATWTSSAPSVASVDAAGKVTAASTGSATITATVEGVSGTASITVTAVPVASVDVTPTTASVAEGATTTLTATAKDAQGNTLTGRPITWSSSDPAIATVSSSGVVTGVKAGTATITATGPAPGGGGSAPSGSATITVTPAPVLSIRISPTSPVVSVGSTLQLSASLFGTDPNLALSPIGRTITWRSADTNVATVSPNGVVTGVNAGTTTITVTAASLGQTAVATASVTLTVAAPSTSQVSRVAIAPLAGSLHVGALYARQVTATAFDASGGVRSNEPITWTSLDPTRLSVTPASSTGTATIVASGTAPGGARLIASAGSASAPVADTITIVLDLVPIATVTVAPTTMTLVTGTSQQATVTAVDSAGNAVGTSAGNPLGGRSISWTTSDAKVATVSSNGVVNAIKRGTAKVEVRVGGVGPARVDVTITNPAGGSVVSSIAIAPTTTTLEQGSTAAFTATALDARGDTVSGPTFSWSLSGGGAQITSTSAAAATVLAVDSGTVTVAAAADGRTGRAVLRITLAAIDSIEAIPNRATPTVALSARQGRSLIVQFRVVSTRGKLPGRAFAVVSSDPSIVTVSTVGRPITDSAGKGEFVAAPAPGAQRGDSALVTVTADGKRTTWRVSIT